MMTVVQPQIVLVMLLILKCFWCRAAAVYILLVLAVLTTNLLDFLLCADLRLNWRITKPAHSAKFPHV